MNDNIAVKIISSTRETFENYWISKIIWTFQKYLTAIDFVTRGGFRSQMTREQHLLETRNGSNRTNRFLKGPIFPAPDIQYKDD